MWQFDKCSGCFSHLLMCVHGPVEMRPLWKWPLTTVHLSDFSPYSTSTTLHLEREIPAGFVSFIAAVMFIKTSGVVMYISVVHFVLRLVTIFSFCKKKPLHSKTKPSSEMFQLFSICQKPKTGNQADWRCIAFFNETSHLNIPACLPHVTAVLAPVSTGMSCLSLDKNVSVNSSWFKQSGPMGIHYTWIGNRLGIVFLYIMVGCVIQDFCN